MEEIRKHIEQNLKDAEKAYNDAYYRHDEAITRQREVNTDVFNAKFDMETADKNVVYFQKLLDELNKNNGNTN